MHHLVELLESAMITLVPDEVQEAVNVEDLQLAAHKLNLIKELERQVNPETRSTAARSRRSKTVSDPSHSRWHMTG